MIDDIVQIIGSHFWLPLLVPHPYLVHFDLFIKVHELAFLLSRLGHVSVDIYATFFIFVAVNSTLNLRADLCPDDNRSEFGHVADSRPKSRLENIEVYLKAEILWTQGEDFILLLVNHRYQAHQVLWSVIFELFRLLLRLLVIFVFFILVVRKILFISRFLLDLLMEIDEFLA